MRSAYQLRAVLLSLDVGFHADFVRFTPETGPGAEGPFSSPVDPKRPSRPMPAQTTCATYSQEPHDNALAAISGYCRQRTTDELLDEIAGHGQRPS
jgi:hypothetical protein